jgi:hypothetical protein
MDGQTPSGHMNGLSRLALELSAMLSSSSCLTDGGSSRGCGSCGNLRPANQPSTTVIRFSVSVPVLSEQMAAQANSRALVHQPSTMHDVHRACEERDGQSDGSLDLRARRHKPQT